MPIKFRNLAADLQHRIEGAEDKFAGFYHDLYVDANNGDDNYTGEDWDNPFATITQALTAAALDHGASRIKAPRIFVARGDYDEGAVLDLNIQDMKLIGPNVSPNHYHALLYSSTATHDLIEIGAHGVSVIGMGLTQTKARDFIQLGDASAEAWYKLYIAGNRFDGWDTGTYGVRAYDETVDCPDMVIEGNLFRSIATASIMINNTRTFVLGNYIFVSASAIGIDTQQTGGNRPDQMIIGNYIIGSNSSDTGIKIASTEPTDGTMLVALNVVTNCGTLITKAKSDAGLVCNYSYIDGTALGQCDPT